MNSHVLLARGMKNTFSIGFSRKKMPYVKIWVHLIFSTKNREKLISKDIKKKLITHIINNGKRKNIYIDRVNGIEDHLHILLSLDNDMSISKAAQLIKGESSYWLNTKKLCKIKFEWQDEYIALSVSESVIPKVRVYIDNQEEHHRKKTFMEEYSEFIKRYGFEKLVKG